MRRFGRKFQRAQSASIKRRIIIIIVSTTPETAESRSFLLQLDGKKNLPLDDDDFSVENAKRR